jgi:hypothetical protein
MVKTGSFTVSDMTYQSIAVPGARIDVPAHPVLNEHDADSQHLQKLPDEVIV